MELLQNRITARLKGPSGRTGKTNAELTTVNDCISKLQLLLPEGEEPMNAKLEAALSDLFPPPEPEPLPPPSFIEILPTVPIVRSKIRRIQVSHDSTFALTQSFAQPFRLNDAVRVLCERENVTDLEEMKRVRAALQGMMNKLVNAGRLLRDEKGGGRVIAIYRRIAHVPPAFRTGVPERRLRKRS